MRLFDVAEGPELRVVKQDMVQVNLNSQSLHMYTDAAYCDADDSAVDAYACKTEQQLDSVAVFCLNPCADEKEVLLLLRLSFFLVLIVLIS